jgi:hypothetical protein
MSAARTTIRCLTRRCGYALVTVILFNVLFLSLLGVAWRHMVSVIRVATVRAEQIERDESLVCAMGRAMRMLETGRPPVNSFTVGSRYECHVSFGPDKYFPITFTLTATNPETWSVAVTEQSTPPISPLLVDAFPP